MLIEISAVIIRAIKTERIARTFRFLPLPYIFLSSIVVVMDRYTSLAL